MESNLRVLFLPDWREGNPYQTLLADALSKQAVDPVFPNGRRRGLPITRAAADADAKLIHLHWPEGFLGQKGQLIDTIRSFRLPLEIAHIGRRIPVVLTAHNITPHTRPLDQATISFSRKIFRSVSRIVCHSEASAEAISEFVGKTSPKDIIPHGDLLDDLPKLPSKREARRYLNFPESSSICLVFGAMKEYKGVSELVDLWKEAAPPATLVIAGKASDSEIAESLTERTKDFDRIEFREGFLEDKDLSAYLSASDMTIFNYRRILTSGGAILARSAGLPIAITERANCVDLGEPDPAVQRFKNDPQSLRRAVEMCLKTNCGSTDQWRASISWQRVAKLTKESYARAMLSVGH